MSDGARSRSLREDDSSNGPLDGGSGSGKALDSGCGDGNLSALDAALGTADRPFVIDEDDGDNDDHGGDVVDLHLPVLPMPFKAAA
jgi:hypothetical protein